jgi:hypothetical protein
MCQVEASLYAEEDNMKSKLMRTSYSVFREQSSQDILSLGAGGGNEA